MLVGLGLSSSCIQRVNAAVIAVPDDYLSIQEAVNNADEGDSILIGNGTYDGGATLKKALMIVGEGKVNTVIEELNVSGLLDVHLKDICVNLLNARNRTSVWATGCRFPEVHISFGARLLLSQSEAWEVHTYDEGEILGFYDLPFFGKVVFSLPFGFIVYLFPILLALAVVAILVLVYIRRKKEHPNSTE